MQPAYAAPLQRCQTWMGDHLGGGRCPAAAGATRCPPGSSSSCSATASPAQAQGAAQALGTLAASNSTFALLWGRAALTGQEHWARALGKVHWALQSISPCISTEARWPALPARQDAKRPHLRPPARRRRMRARRTAAAAPAPPLGTGLPPRLRGAAADAGVGKQWWHGAHPKQVCVHIRVRNVAEAASSELLSWLQSVPGRAAHLWQRPQSAPRRRLQPLPSTAQGRRCHRRGCWAAGCRRAAASQAADAAGSCLAEHPAGRSGARDNRVTAQGLEKPSSH